MTAADLIARAERALLTGQPNLSALYMRRARELTAGERATIKQDYRKARTQINPLASWQFAALDLTEGFRAFAKAFQSSVSHPLVQTDFTLAGPSKGGAA